MEKIFFNVIQNSVVDHLSHCKRMTIYYFNEYARSSAFSTFLFSWHLNHSLMN